MFIILEFESPRQDFPALKMLRQENYCEFEASLDSVGSSRLYCYRVNSCLETKKENPDRTGKQE